MNWDLIEQLLNVVDKSVAHPKLMGITNAALAKLEQLANPDPTPNTDLSGRRHIPDMDQPNDA